jgi:hypothetical protein
VLSECDGGTHVALEQRVSADKPILRVLSPVLKPLFAANHRWTTPRGEAGLRAYLAERGLLNADASAELPSRRRGWVPVPLVGALLGAGALTVYWLLRQRH